MAEIIPVTLALIGVVALMLGSAYIVKWLRTRVMGEKGQRGIRVSSCTGIGQDKSVMAVRAGGKNLLIGVTQNSISLLCELSEEDMAIIENTVSDSDDRPVGKSFAECFKYNLKKMGGEFITPRSPEKDDDGDSADSL